MGIFEYFFKFLPLDYIPGAWFFFMVRVRKLFDYVRGKKSPSWERQYEGSSQS